MQFPGFVAVLAISITAAPTATVRAQTCGANSQLAKNDQLPAVPSGTFPHAIVPGLCNGEAAMAVLDLGYPVKVHQVSALYAHQSGTNGVQAVVDIEIYDGATVDGQGRWTLGPQVFRLSNGGSHLQIQSSGLNTYALPQPVSVPSGRVVVGYRMVQNLASGSCTFGYSANFATDASQTATCTTVPGKNILDTQQFGPVDPATFGGFGVPLCPRFFNGAWVIRACVEPEVTVTWTGNATPGGVISLTYVAPNESGNSYLALVSGGISMGTLTPWGRLPLDGDSLFFCFLGPCRGLLIGSQGTIGAGGTAAGGLVIPNLPVLQGSGLQMYVGFFTYTQATFPPWITVSAPSAPIVIQ